MRDLKSLEKKRYKTDVRSKDRCLPKVACKA